MLNSFGGRGGGWFGLRQMLSRAFVTITTEPRAKVSKWSGGLFGLVNWGTFMTP